MTGITTSRRNLLRAGTCLLVGISGPLSTTDAFASQNGDEGERGASTVDKEDIIRTYYSGYEKKDWKITGDILADNFTFSSPNGDNHISKSVFKERCFLSQLGFIQRFELETVLTSGNEAFVKYVCRTTGAPFQNIDYFRFAGDKVSAIECFFGAKLGYPSGAASRKG